MTIPEFAQWIRDNFNAPCYQEAAYHLLNLRWALEKERILIGLADNVWLKGGDGPFNNCPVYKREEGLRVVVEGTIYNPVKAIERGYQLEKEFSDA